MIGTLKSTHYLKLKLLGMGLLCIWSLAACGSKDHGQEEIERQKTRDLSRQAQMITFNQLQKRLEDTRGKTLIVNFWATWCKPCVEEMPAFLKLAREDRDFHLLLVSLDDPEKRTSQVLPFLRKNDIRQEVVILEQPNGGEWISTIAPSWSGAIPATLAVNSSKGIREFRRQSFTYNELKSFYQQIPTP